VEAYAPLFLNDFGVLDHRNSAALGHLALHGDRLAAILRELIVHRFVFANHEIRFAFAHDADGAAASDALGPAGLPVFFAHRVMIDVAHHVDHFAADSFFSRCAQILFCTGRAGARRRRVFVLLRNGQRRKGQSRDESGDRNVQNRRFLGC
jgi:hypothetical protein